jgi:hypothetical protein
LRTGSPKLSLPESLSCQMENKGPEDRDLPKVPCYFRFKAMTSTLVSWFQIIVLSTNYVHLSYKKKWQNPTFLPRRLHPGEVKS